MANQFLGKGGSLICIVWLCLQEWVIVQKWPVCFSRSTQLFPYLYICKTCKIVAYLEQRHQLSSQRRYVQLLDLRSMHSPCHPSLVHLPQCGIMLQAIADAQIAPIIQNMQSQLKCSPLFSRARNSEKQAKTMGRDPPILCNKSAS